MKEIGDLYDAIAAHTFGNEFRTKGRCDQAPFGGRIGMRQTAAKRSAHPDWIVRDVMGDKRQQPSERTLGGGPIEGGVPHAGADRELAVRRRQPPERCDAVDVDQMSRA